jgi:hypothetical protein
MGGAGGGGPGSIFRVGRAKPVIVKEGQVIYICNTYTHTHTHYNIYVYIICL